MRGIHMIVGTVILLAPLAATGTDPAAPAGPKKIDSRHLPNCYQLTDKVFSGGLPAGDDAFRELRDLGVKTIVSVDGSQPEVEAAKKYGLRYVHLPHGYDGVPADRVFEIAKVVRDLPGPVYVHCHHGKHRSPAAAASACVTLGMLDTAGALAVLKAAGTNPSYRGLYRSVESAQKVDPAQLDRLPADFPEAVAVPPLAEAMVGVEHTHDRLKSIGEAGWITPSGQPDLEPPHEALLLQEHFVELLRAPEVINQPQDFQDLLRASEKDATELHAALEANPVDPMRSQALFDRVSANCKACHQKFRDNPTEKK